MKTCNAQAGDEKGDERSAPCALQPRHGAWGSGHGVPGRRGRNRAKRFMSTPTGFERTARLGKTQALYADSLQLK